MASKKRRTGNKSSKDALSQFGIHLDIPNFDGGIEDVDSIDADDDTLEAELNALLGSDGQMNNAGRRGNTGRQKETKSAVGMHDIEQLASQCLTEGADDDVSTDDEIMDELEALNTGSPSPDKDSVAEDAVSSSPQTSDVIELLEERLKMYKEAEIVSKESGDQFKARRYNRAIKALNSMLSSARSGCPINEEEIPPPVRIPKPKAPTGKDLSPDDSQIPGAKLGAGDDGTESEIVTNSEVPSVDHETLLVSLPSLQSQTLDEQLKNRKQAYKTAAVKAKREGNNEVALEYMKNIKKLDFMIGCVGRDEPVDLTDIPPPLDDIGSVHYVINQLYARKNTYSNAVMKAQEIGSAEAAELFANIVKKFDAIIKDAEAGQHVNLDNVPPPLSESAQRKIMQQNMPSASSNSSSTAPAAAGTPTEVTSEMEAAALAAASESDERSVFNAPPPATSILEALEQRLNKYIETRDAAKAENNTSKVRRLQRIVKQYEDVIKKHKAGIAINYEELPAPPGFGPIPTEEQLKPPNQAARAQKVVDRKQGSSEPSEARPSPPKKTSIAKEPVRPVRDSIKDRQLNFLLKRQQLFREAAVESKKYGDVKQAMEYMSMAKGFSKMIDAVKSGLPIDISKCPTPPQLDGDYVIVEKSECVEDSDNGEDLFVILQKDLRRQIELCIQTREYFLKLGDVTSASKFEKLHQNAKRDVLFITQLQNTGGKAPKFHYETRIYSLIQSNTDLKDGEIEVAVVRGINFPGKSTLDSYVKVEFPLPSDSPQHGKTHTIYDTTDPAFNEVFHFEFSRVSRSHLRIFKRHALKCEVWSKGSFFRGDSLIGIAQIKLVDFETKCSVHDCFDLYTGRKATGGKLEVKVRLKDPLLKKQVNEMKEKWLVIDS